MRESLLLFNRSIPPQTTYLGCAGLSGFAGLSGVKKDVILEPRIPVVSELIRSHFGS